MHAHATVLDTAHDRPCTSIVAHVCRLALGGVFVLAALFKLTHAAEFVILLESLPMLSGVPGPALQVFGHALGAGECLLAAMLFTRSRPRLASRLVLATLLVFTFVVATQFEQLAGSCGCFWSVVDIVPMTLELLLARNAVFLAAAVVVWRDARSS